MKPATRSDKNLVVAIITDTFEKNPGVNWLLRTSGNRRKKIKRLAEFAFIKALDRNGVFISSNRKGVAICYPFNQNKFSLIEMFYELRFALSSIKLSRLPEVLKREAYRKKQRPTSGKYLYFWFLGVLPGGDKAAYELKDAIFDYAQKVNLPIYLETAMERNKIIYERYGFQTFHYWNDEKENIRFWFLKWDPKKVN